MNGAGVDVPTRLAWWLGRAWSILVIAFGALVAVVAPLAIAEQRDSGYCESGDHPGDCGSTAAPFVGGLVAVGAGVAGLKASTALRRGEPWGRRAMVAIFGLWALVLAGGLLRAGGSGGDVSAGSLVQWGVVLAVLATIVTASLRARPGGGPGPPPPP